MAFVYIILAYIVLIWVVARLVIPHLGFYREHIPKKIPAELEKKISECNRAARDNVDFLTLAYMYVTHRYTGSRGKTITQFWKAFGGVYDMPPGYLPCTQQNHLLRTMLIKSGRFQESDIEIKTIPLNIFIHQYLRVKVGGGLHRC